jgi:cytoskeleton protein RodZ
MNEPASVEPLPASADGGIRAAPTGFGYALAQARVRAGLSIEQAAARIRLHPKQLQAIENEDLQLLPAAAYVNGFVRNYAREIGIDSGPLIDDLNAKLKLRGLAGPEPDLGAGGPIHGPMLDDRGWRHLVLAGIVIALVCAGLIGLWRMAGSASAPTAASSAAAGKPAEVPSPAETPALARNADTGAKAGAMPELDSNAIATASSAQPASPSSNPETTAGSATEGSPAVAPGAPAPGAKEGRIPVATVASPTGATSGLLVRFVERSWVEVSKPDGRVLLSHIGEAGSIELVNASAPLVLVIGRADAVKVEYRGQAVNLKPYVNATNGVARVLLAEGDAVSGGQSNR